MDEVMLSDQDRGRRRYAAVWNKALKTKILQCSWTERKNGRDAKYAAREITCVSDSLARRCQTAVGEHL